MSRIAFRLRVRPECIAEYEAAHERVWPELLAVLKAAGICQYSIFRLESDLFFYMHVDHFDKAWSEIEASPVNALWQAEMAPLFEPMGEPGAGQRFPMMKEVFFLA